MSDPTFDEIMARLEAVEQNIRDLTETMRVFREDSLQRVSRLEENAAALTREISALMVVTKQLTTTIAASGGALRAILWLAGISVAVAGAIAEVLNLIRH